MSLHLPPAAEGASGKYATVVERTRSLKITHCSATYLPLSTCHGNGCPFYNHGCMAQHGNIRIHEKRLKRDVVRAIIQEARLMGRLSATAPCRLRISGDQPDEESLRKHTAPAARLYHSRHRQPIWTYSHNWHSIDISAWGVISVLASVHSLEEARTANAAGYAAAIVLPEVPANTWKDGEDTMIHCPGEWKNMLCINCKLCFKHRFLKENKLHIVFTPHGSGKNTLLARYRSGAAGRVPAPETAAFSISN